MNNKVIKIVDDWVEVETYNGLIFKIDRDDYISFLFDGLEPSIISINGINRVVVGNNKYVQRLLAPQYKRVTNLNRDTLDVRKSNLIEYGRLV